MHFKVLLCYFLGYLEIEVEGYFIEKFINNCLKSSVFLWNIKRKKSTIMTCNIGIKDFKKRARKEIEKLTAMNVVELDVVAKNIYVPEKEN